MQTYSDKIKAQVIGEWLAGATQNQLAARHKMPKSTVALWTKSHPRTAAVPDQDLAAAFGLSVYRRAMEALDALGAHLRAAATPELAGTAEGWSDRVADITRTIVTLGSAIQRGQPEPIRITGHDD